MHDPVPPPADAAGSMVAVDGVTTGCEGFPSMSSGGVAPVQVVMSSIPRPLAENEKDNLQSKKRKQDVIVE